MIVLKIQLKNIDTSLVYEAEEFDYGNQFLEITITKKKVTYINIDSIVAFNVEEK